MSTNEACKSVNDCRTLKIKDHKFVIEKFKTNDNINCIKVTTKSMKDGEERTLELQDKHWIVPEYFTKFSEKILEITDSEISNKLLNHLKLETVTNRLEK